MRVPGRPNVWAVGDCAAIPDPQGNPYPTLAQHALREGKHLAANIAAVRHSSVSSETTRNFRDALVIPTSRSSHTAWSSPDRSN